MIASQYKSASLNKMCTNYIISIIILHTSYIIILLQKKGDIVLAVSPPAKMKPGVEDYIKKMKVVAYGKGIMIILACGCQP